MTTIPIKRTTTTTMTEDPFSLNTSNKANLTGFTTSKANMTAGSTDESHEARFAVKDKTKIQLYR